MGMIVSMPKIKTFVIIVAFPRPLQWTGWGEQLGIVAKLRYLGIILDAMHGMRWTFFSLKKNMFGA